MGSGSNPGPVSGDLETPEDVAEMVRRFYGDVAQDDLLGPAFNQVAAVDWSEHLPKLTAFWSRFLFKKPGYEGNPYRRHAEVHQRRPFTIEQFQRWLLLFNETVDLGWRGPNAQRVKELAARVAEVHSKQLIGEAVVAPDRQRLGLNPPGAGTSVSRRRW